MNRRDLFSAAAASFILTACAAPSVPQSRFYRLVLTEKPARVAERPRWPGHIEIDIFSANGIAGDRPLLYSSDEGQTLMQRNYAYWAEPPAPMIRSLVSDYLQSTNLFSSVGLSELRVPAQYRLRGRLTSLFEKVEDKDGARGIGAQIGLDLNLLDLEKDRVLLGKSYEQTFMPPGSTIDDFAQAVNKGVAVLLGHFATDLKAVA